MALRRGLKASKRFAGRSEERFAILVAQLIGRLQSLAHPRREIGSRLAKRVLGFPHLGKRHMVEEFGG